MLYSKENELFSAAINGVWDRVFSLIGQGVDVNCPTFGFTRYSHVLLQAIRQRELNIALRLIEKGANTGFGISMDGSVSDFTLLKLARELKFYDFANELVKTEYLRVNRSPGLVVYVLLTSFHCVGSGILGKSIIVIFYDHVLSIGYMVDHKGHAIILYKECLIDFIDDTDAVFAFSMPQTCLPKIYEKSKLLQEQNNEYSSLNFNCADVAKYMLSDILKKDPITCDFYTFCLPPIPSPLQYITNTTHVFKQIYWNIKSNDNDILLEKNLRQYTELPSLRRFIAFNALCVKSSQQGSCAEIVSDVEQQFLLDKDLPFQRSYGTLRSQI